MVDIVFRGDSDPVAQIETITIGGTWANLDTATITINGKDVIHTAITGALTVTDIVAGLIVALGATGAGEFGELTWADADPDITGTANTAGVPHTITVSKTGASGTISTTTTISSSGPAELRADNLTGGSLPSASDTLTFEDSTQDLLYTLAAIDGTLLTELIIKSNYTGSIGLPRVNDAATPSYHEYREREFTVDATNITIGDGAGNGSSLLILDCSATNSIIEVSNTGSPSGDFKALRIHNTGATATLRAYGSSSIDLAPETGQTATFTTLDISGSADVRISDGVTVGTLRIRGSATVDLDQASALTDITLIEIAEDATLTIRGDNAITTLNVFGNAEVTDLGEGTIATLIRGPEATYTNDNSAIAPGGRILTNVTLEPGEGVFRTRGVTFTNDIDIGRASLTDHPNFDPGFDDDIGFS